MRRDYSREKAGPLTDKDKDDIIIKKIRDLGFSGKINLHPVIPDISNTVVNLKHIDDRNHSVSADEAKMYISNAKIMISKWNGTSHNYYSKYGASYLYVPDNEIRTAFSADEYDYKTVALMKELERNGV